MRDDFSVSTKETLAKRVGMQCSNPNCRKVTAGPSSDQNKSLNIGVASHITAASPGGKRYDAALTEDERKSIENGIWLCQNCAKLIDNDDHKFTVQVIREWKRLSEEAALLEVQCSSHVSLVISDIEMVKFYAQCFDRPAFQDPFEREGSMRDFDKAIEDTITAINTGCLRSRDGTILSQGRGKAFLANQQWRMKMDSIVDMLRAIRSKFKEGVESGEIKSCGNCYCAHHTEITFWMDHTRSEIMRSLGEICLEAGIKPLSFPRRHW